mmetsp:Transcript_12356/g.1112  ORF Transcript_12356/g.1112 Transcript_12356/m.1112 type:complete len:89 (-) Transcript_12356:184-450(-)
MKVKVNKKMILGIIAYKKMILAVIMSLVKIAKTRIAKLIILTNQLQNLKGGIKKEEENIKKNRCKIRRENLLLTVGYVIYVMILIKEM